MITTWEDHTTTLSNKHLKTAEVLLSRLGAHRGNWKSLEWLSLEVGANTRTVKKCIQYLRDQGHFILSSQKGYCYYDREKNGPIEPGSDAWKFLESLREMAWRHGASYMRMRDIVVPKIDNALVRMTVSGYEFPPIELPEYKKP